MRGALGFVGRAVLTGLAFVIAQAVAGAVLEAAGFEAPALPEGADAETLGVLFFATSPLIGMALGALMAGLGGSFFSRALSVFGIVYVAQGVNTALEAGAFSTTASAVGEGQRYFLLIYLLPALLAAAVAAGLWRSHGERPPKAPFVLAQLPFRIAASILAFVVIYLEVGTLISPWVIDVYRSGTGELVLPSMSTIVPLQFVRGTLLVLACLPVLYGWRGQRQQLVLRLGFALWILMGGSFMSIASWLPATLRLVHAGEILVDALLFAGALVTLLPRASPKAAERRAGALA